MIRQIRNSVILLAFLGALLAVPIVGKTWSAHGALPALATGLGVVVAIVLGPMSFLFTGAIERQVTIATSVATDLEVTLMLLLGAALVFAWFRSVARSGGGRIPYLPVAGWALVGTHFCLLQIFTHIT